MNILIGLLFIFFGIMFILQPAPLYKRIKNKGKTEADIAFLKVIMRFGGIVLTISGVLYVVTQLSIFLFDS